MKSVLRHSAGGQDRDRRDQRNRKINSAQDDRRGGDADAGQIIRQNGLKIAYVAQNPVFPDGADIRSYAFTRGAGEDWQAESNLRELGITRFDEKISHLSGGQKRRVVLAKTLAEDFDVLLLDERQTIWTGR